jgi:hypothetical protein
MVVGGTAPAVEFLAMVAAWACRSGVKRESYLEEDTASTAVVTSAVASAVASAVVVAITAIARIADCSDRIPPTAEGLVTGPA